MARAKVWCATIVDDDRDVTVFVAATEEALQAEVYAWVSDDDRWTDLRNNGHDDDGEMSEDIPDDRGEAIETFFRYSDYFYLDEHGQKEVSGS